MPVLNPANVEEIVELGFYGYALSRFSGCWVGLKVTQETADATQSFALLPQGSTIVTPEFALPPGGLNIRWPDPPNDQEFRLQRYKLPAALAFARANALDRTIIDSRYPRLGIGDDGQGASRRAAGARGSWASIARARPTSASSCSRSA